uniref:Uncharacterized protein n=1 Tax=Zea mays TaxID=4577 RepID=A0A804LRV7_MAIZE
MHAKLRRRVEKGCGRIPYERVGMGMGSTPPAAKFALPPVEFGEVESRVRRPAPRTVCYNCFAAKRGRERPDARGHRQCNGAADFAGGKDPVFTTMDARHSVGEDESAVRPHLAAEATDACARSHNTDLTWFVLDDTPFVPSTARNRFTIIGGYKHDSSDLYVAGCYSYCQGIGGTSDDGAACTGTGCCETTISSNLTEFEAILYNQSAVWTFNPCF